MCPIHCGPVPRTPDYHPGPLKAGFFTALLGLYMRCRSRLCGNRKDDGGMPKGWGGFLTHGQLLDADPATHFRLLDADATTHVWLLDADVARRMGDVLPQPAADHQEEQGGKQDRQSMPEGLHYLLISSRPHNLPRPSKHS